MLEYSEVKCTEADMPSELKRLGFSAIVWHEASKAGYAGTAILSKIPLVSAKKGLGEVDNAGTEIFAFYFHLSLIILVLTL